MKHYSGAIFSRRKRANPEEKFHIEVAKFLNLALPPDAFWTTIPTVGSSRIQGAKLKAKGYKAGTLDLTINFRKLAYWIELKAPDGRLSDEQVQVCRALTGAGVPHAICKTLDEIQDWLDRWDIPLRARLEPRTVGKAREVA